MKIAYIVLFVIFLSFSAVQLNDPDPFIWTTIYGVVAMVSLLSLFGIFQRSMVFLLMILVGTYALIHFHYFWDWLLSNNKGEIFGEMIYEKAYIEGTREFIGLVLADLTLAFHLYWKHI